MTIPAESLLTSKIPNTIIEKAQEYFDPVQLRKAIRLVEQSQVSLSFSRGSLDHYFVCSGIIQDEKNYEAKITYKKRIIEDPISSLCHCSEWTPEEHCLHTMSLFLSFLLLQHHSSPLPRGESSLAVTPKQYGTLLNSPGQLNNAPLSSSYASLHYLLDNRKILGFPIPEVFEGKLILQIQTRPFSLKFKYQDKNQHIHEKISLFGTLYLFNWTTGRAYHLSHDIKNLILNLNFYEERKDPNAIIRLGKSHPQDFIQIMVDEIPLDKIPTLDPQCKIYLLPQGKLKPIQFKIIFQNQQGHCVRPPDFLTHLTFNDGFLDSFSKRKNAYSFIKSFAHYLSSKEDRNYKQYLNSSSQKNDFQRLIDETLSQKKSYCYCSQTQTFSLYNNHFLITLFKELVDSFGSAFFKRNRYDFQNNEIVFYTHQSLILQGFFQLYQKMSPFKVQFFYHKNHINLWNSKVRFERKSHNIKWFDINLKVAPEDLEIIQKATPEDNIILTQKGLVLLNQDQKNILKFLKKYIQHEKNQNQNQKELPIGKKNSPAIFNFHFNRARIIELFELRKLGVDGALTKEEIQLCKKLMTLEELPQYSIPSKLDPILRSYQRVGYFWLRFLFEHKLGACLADDMGLGKTLQTITFLQSIYNKINKVLIVCPISIILNWEKEFKKFSDMDVFIYHGEDRTIPQDTRILITSYGIMKKEAENIFSDQFFDILILDEVQKIKNINSQGAQAARKIKSGYCICLTGTPLENDLSEFYNILDLSVPGIWGDQPFLRRAASKNLRLFARQTARPFILRRTKQQVLTELPPKMENDIYLAFEKGERENYLTSLFKIRQKLQSIEPKKRYGEVLRGLLELRQKCLWQKDESLDIHSSKIKFLVETLEPIIQEGHQALVFSQFTTYLDIIQKTLQEKSWKMARIDGSQNIKQRQKEVDRFQNGTCPLLLISLKAGGIGLNLTAASYVFIMDPWWNPAVETQAVDRAHRIGQKNALTVYRPIIEESIEEKVLKLQKTKKELFKDLFPENESEFYSGKLTMKDFESLFN